LQARSRLLQPRMCAGAKERCQGQRYSPAHRHTLTPRVSGHCHQDSVNGRKSSSVKINWQNLERGSVPAVVDLHRSGG
jgi:hypothetical protein